MFKSTWQKVFLAVIVSGMSSLLFTTVFIWSCFRICKTHYFHLSEFLCLVYLGYIGFGIL